MDAVQGSGSLPRSQGQGKTGNLIYQPTTQAKPSQPGFEVFMTRSPFHHDKPETSNVQLERSSCIMDPQGSRSPFEDSMMCVRLSRCCPAVTLACRPALHNNTCILSICMGLSEFLCVLAVCWRFQVQCYDRPAAEAQPFRRSLAPGTMRL